MNVDLEKYDLVNLLCGTQPDLDKSINLLNVGLMDTYGHGASEFKWQRNVVEKLSEEELLHIYYLITKRGD